MCNFQSIHLPIGFILVMTILSACTEGKETKPLFSSFEFVKEREFLIHSLSTVELLDYHPETGMYLGYAHVQGGKEIVLVTEDGQIELRRNMQGDGPDKYGATLSCLGFAENGDIWALTSVQLLRYNQKLELLERISYKPERMVTLYYFVHKFQFFRIESDAKGIAFPVNPSGYSRQSLATEEYHDARMLEVYDIASTKSIEFGTVKERCVTEEFLTIARGFYSPIFSIESKSRKMYFSASFDNQVSIIDLSTNAQINTIPISFDGREAAPCSNSEIDPTRLKVNSNSWLQLPMNYKIHLLDSNQFLLQYIPNAALDPSPKEGSLLASLEHDVFKSRFILFDEERQISKDIDLPIRGVVALSIPGNRLLVRVDNPNVEEDFTRYHLYCLEQR